MAQVDGSGTAAFTKIELSLKPSLLLSSVPAAGFAAPISHPFHIGRPKA